jgi:hypothetical protein
MSPIKITALVQFLAMMSAASTTSVSRVTAIDHLTILRLNTSIRGPDRESRTTSDCT